MGTYDLGTIVKAIETVLSAAAALVDSQVYDTLTEGIHEYPTLQVYPAANTGTSWNTQTDRMTFSGKVPAAAASATHLSVKEYTINADLFGQQRTHINEDMAALVGGIEDIEQILDTQEYSGGGLFGRPEIYDFRWSWNYVVFDYGGVGYVGARFTIMVRCGMGHTVG